MTVSDMEIAAAQFVEKAEHRSKCPFTNEETWLVKWAFAAGAFYGHAEALKSLEGVK